MIVSKRNGKIDTALFTQHLREMPDGEYHVQLTHLDSPTKKQLAYFFSHIVPIYQGYLASAGVRVSKSVAGNFLKEAVGFGEPIIDFEVDLGLTEREWQEMIESSFYKLIELGCNPVHPNDR